VGSFGKAVMTGVSSYGLGGLLFRIPVTRPDEIVDAILYLTSIETWSEFCFQGTEYHVRNLRLITAMEARQVLDTSREILFLSNSSCYFVVESAALTEVGVYLLLLLHARCLFSFG
jgi:hypothetical protein